MCERQGHLTAPPYLWKNARPNLSRNRCLCVNGSLAPSLARFLPPPPFTHTPNYRFPAKRGQLQRVEGLLCESQGNNQALTGIQLPYSLDSGWPDVERYCHALSHVKMGGGRASVEGAAWLGATE